tara:strand:+ start:143 stop:502 length:360 start_codon:yes stop_codon:yes gene_type:complete
MNPLEITLPWPPSVNTYWRNFDGRTIISLRGREYREAIQKLIMVNRLQKHFDGPLRVTIAAYRPDKRRRDLDNLLKATCDALCHAGVYEDDSQIHDLRIYWAPEIGGMLKIKIEDLEQM